MSKSSNKGTVAYAREGKSYGYQAAEESVVDPSGLADRKTQLMKAFENFIEGMVGQPGSAPPVGTTGTAGTTGTTGTTGTPGGATGGSTTPGTGTGAGYSGTAPPGSGAGTGTGRGPVTGTERPLSEAAKAAAAKEALELTIYSQREAYRIDRAREATRRSRLAEASAVSAQPPAPGVAPSPTLSKHTSDSNRAPLTTSKEFAPAFGAHGKNGATTMEKMAVSSKRPETVPAPGTVRAGRPIDAYWASFGTAVERAQVRAKVDYKIMESIIGTDDRVRVTNNEVYPWRCICSLLITAQNGSQWIGTGWLVAPRLVLTAGHCVYMADEGGWASQIEVIPGRDGESRPFGSALARDFRSVSGWTQSNDSDYDYGAILLPADKRYGEQLGWFGYAARADDYLRALTLNLAGYPGDGGKTATDGPQWFHSRTVKDVMEKQISYEIDTYGGQSGAPVWEMTSDGSRYGVAIHTWGTTVSNGGTRITGELFDNIVLWAGQAP